MFSQRLEDLTRQHFLVTDVQGTSTNDQFLFQDKLDQMHHELAILQKKIDQLYDLVKNVKSHPEQLSSSSTQFTNSFINENRPPIDLSDHVLNDTAKEIWFPYLQNLVIDRYRAKVGSWDEIEPYYQNLKGNFRFYKDKYRFIWNTHATLQGLLTKFILEYFIKYRPVVRASEIVNSFLKKYNSNRYRTVNTEVYSILRELVQVEFIQSQPILTKQSINDKNNDKRQVTLYIAPFAREGDIEKAISEYYKITVGKLNNKNETIDDLVDKKKGRIIADKVAKAQASQDPDFQEAEKILNDSKNSISTLPGKIEEQEVERQLKNLLDKQKKEAYKNRVCEFNDCHNGYCDKFCIHCSKIICITHLKDHIFYDHRDTIGRGDLYPIDKHFKSISEENLFFYLNSKSDTTKLLNNKT